MTERKGPEVGGPSQPGGTSGPHGCTRLGRGASDLAKAGLPSSSAPSRVPAPARTRHVSSGQCGHFGVLGGAGAQETCFCGIAFPRYGTVANSRVLTHSEGTALSLLQG